MDGCVVDRHQVQIRIRISMLMPSPFQIRIQIGIKTMPIFMRILPNVGKSEYFFLISDHRQNIEFFGKFFNFFICLALVRTDPVPAK
jgi:hypothetical protein